MELDILPHLRSHFLGFHLFSVQAEQIKYLLSPFLVAVRLLLGATAALAVTGLGLVNYVQNLGGSGSKDMTNLAIVVGGGLATWGYLKSSGVVY